MFLIVLMLFCFVRSGFWGAAITIANKRVIGAEMLNCARFLHVSIWWLLVFANDYLLIDVPACSALFSIFFECACLVSTTMNVSQGVSEPTVLGRFNPPRSRGVDGFSFPVYRFIKRAKGKREKRVFLSWKTRNEDCSLERKEWQNFSWLPPKIKASAGPLLSDAVDITEKKLRIIGREQQQLWSSAVKSARSSPRPFDIKRKKRIETQTKGLKRFSVPTCLPEYVGKQPCRSEAVVIIGPGTHKGDDKLTSSSSP